MSDKYEAVELEDDEGDTLFAVMDSEIEWAVAFTETKEMAVTVAKALNQYTETRH